MASYTPGPRDDPRGVAQRLVAVWAAHAGGIRREGHDAARVAAGPAAVAGFEVPHDLAAHLVVGLTGRLVTPGLAVLIRRAGRIGLRPAAAAAGRCQADGVDGPVEGMDLVAGGPARRRGRRRARPSGNARAMRPHWSRQSRQSAGWVLVATRFTESPLAAESPLSAAESPLSVESSLTSGESGRGWVHSYSHSHRCRCKPSSSSAGVGWPGVARRGACQVFQKRAPTWAGSPCRLRPS